MRRAARSVERAHQLTCVDRMKAATQEVGRRGAVLITGGGSGLGEAVARRLRSDGLSVMIADLNPASAKLAASIGAEFSLCDVSSEKNVQETVDKTVASFGSLSATVNCAGIAIAQKVLSKKGGWLNFVSLSLFFSIHSL